MGTEKLVVLTGPLKGKSFSIQERVNIGRNPYNTIQFDDLQVSRNHAVVQRTAKGVVLRDLGSSNGTYIGDRRIIEYRLSVGDVVAIGNQQLRFEGTSDKAPSALAIAAHSGNQRGDSRSFVYFTPGAGQHMEVTEVADVHATMFEAASIETTEDKLRHLQNRLKAVYAANQIIASERNLNKLFHRVMDQIFALIPAHNGIILLKDKTTGEWVEEHARSNLLDKKIKASSSIVNRAYENGEAILTVDAADDVRFRTGDSIVSQNIASTMCVPLTHQDYRLGVVYVDTHGTPNAFDRCDLELLVALAGPAAISIRNAQYLRKIEKSYEDTLTVLANAIELRDHYTVGHTARVTNFCVEIARELGWDEERLKQVRMGAVLHDVGKIAVDNAILSKPSNLTPQEYAKIKVHPQRGQDLLQDVEFLHPLIPFCLYHHERYDGNGYPFGLARDKIPIEGRIVAVADTFDAMTSNRPYRKGLDPAVAIAELERGVGTQFDPECVRALVSAFRAGRIDNLLQDYHKENDRTIVCPFCSSSIPIAKDAIPGDQSICHVCGRTMLIVEKNNTYYGELIPQSAAFATPAKPISQEP